MYTFLFTNGGNAFLWLGKIHFWLTFGATYLQRISEGKNVLLNPGSACKTPTMCLQNNNKFCCSEFHSKKHIQCSGTSSTESEPRQGIFCKHHCSLFTSLILWVFSHRAMDLTDVLWWARRPNLRSLVPQNLFPISLFFLKHCLQPISRSPFK